MPDTNDKFYYLVTFEKVCVDDSGHAIIRTFAGILGEDDLSNSEDENVRSAVDQMDEGEAASPFVHHRPATKAEMEGYMRHKISVDLQTSPRIEGADH